ncbi:hypothetical protein [Luteolibacter sp. AS25]|uniref:hypothetical protein n=1 Tax=Luteolibacter sp. AS25 TaxID=3135776 RepID=UPI00398B7F5B
MKLFASGVLALAIALSSCAPGPGGGEAVIWTVGEYDSLIPHVPGVSGYRQIESEAIGFRKYRLQHPGGRWTVGLDGKKDPIVITTASGRKTSLPDEWYPEEGGADAATVYGFVKDDETLIVLEGTSDITYEETWIWFLGDKKVDMKRYAAKGPGMGTVAGVEPKYRVYPSP